MINRSIDSYGLDVSLFFRFENGDVINFYSGYGKFIECKELS